jgi:hypothetical protein
MLPQKVCSLRLALTIQYVKLKKLNHFVYFSKLNVKSGIGAIFETILKFEITVHLYLQYDIIILFMEATQKRSKKIITLVIKKKWKEKKKKN